MAEFEYLSLKAEADRLQRVFIRDGHEEARRQLMVLLDRAKRLSGSEKTVALDFNARLVTELRERGVHVFRVPPASLL